ncbi:YfiR family protein [Thalassotalea euphylliae]|uniref:YfiR family protein n=1 Tax=Thalassotalea euphylliae TaxID=1655234 RepID=A0A3E0TKB0_9GAMM|nr:YfiR family protein [Thalassotalea euphylliae]REL24405.1 YfiR family protein [Thalassotalea euphylliae]
MFQLITQRVQNVRLAILALILALVPLTHSSANDEISTKYQVMAGFLLQLPSYVQWADNSSEIHLCLVGDDMFGGFIDQVLAAKVAKGASTSIQINRIPQGESLERCHLAFFSSLPSAGYLATQQRVLLVGQHEDFIDAGGMVNFYLAQSRLKFEINLTKVKQQGLAMSSQLLKLAKITGR